MRLRIRRPWAENRRFDGIALRLLRSREGCRQICPGDAFSGRYAAWGNRTRAWFDRSRGESEGGSEDFGVQCIVRWHCLPNRDIHLHCSISSLMPRLPDQLLRPPCADDGLAFRYTSHVGRWEWQGAGGFYGHEKHKKSRRVLGRRVAHARSCSANTDLPAVPVPFFLYG